MKVTATKCNTSSKTSFSSPTSDTFSFSSPTSDTFHPQVQNSKIDILYSHFIWHHDADQNRQNLCLKRKLQYVKFVALTTSLSIYVEIIRINHKISLYGK